MQKTTFLKINVFFSKMFIKFKCRRLQTGLAIIKNIKHLNFFKQQIFYAIFKNRIFPRFLKIISSTRKNHCVRLILCQHGRQNPTKLDESIPHRKKCLTASHFRFQSKNSRIDFTAFINDFLNFFSRTVTSYTNKKSLKISLPYSR